ncbi:MAG: hypothetical protein WCP55_15155 [Lentisphaerota bacterium]
MSVHALKIGFLNADVALAAGAGNVGVVNRRIAVHAAANVMDAMAVVTGWRHNQAQFDQGTSMDAFHVLRRRLRKLHAILGRQVRVAVAARQPEAVTGLLQKFSIGPILDRPFLLVIGEDRPLIPVAGSEG